jgi:hypothetical protein
MFRQIHARQRDNQAHQRDKEFVPLQNAGPKVRIISELDLPIAVDILGDEEMINATIPVASWAG